MKTNKTFADELSTWSKNGLSRLYSRDILKKPEVIAEAGVDRLSMTVQLGKKSFQQIADALFRFEYIDNVERWLGG